MEPFPHFLTAYTATSTLDFKPDCSDR